MILVTQWTLVNMTIIFILMRWTLKIEIIIKEISCININPIIKRIINIRSLISKIDKIFINEINNNFNKQNKFPVLLKSNLCAENVFAKRRNVLKCIVNVLLQICPVLNNVLVCLVKILLNTRKKLLRLKCLFKKKES